MTTQYIETNGHPQYAIIPIADYQILCDKAEMLDDIKAFDAATAENDELIPAAVVNRLLAGDNKIKVWREFRGLTQTQISELADIAQATVAQLETGKRDGTVAILKKLAAVLVVDLDDLV